MRGDNVCPECGADADEFDGLMAAHERQVADLQQRLSAAEKERDDRMSPGMALALRADMARFKQERDEALAWGEKLKAKLRDAMEWNWLDNDIEQHCDVESFLQLIDDPAPAALSHLRQEIRREALEEAAQKCEKQWDIDGQFTADEFAAAIRRLAEEQEGKK